MPYRTPASGNDFDIMTNPTGNPAVIDMAGGGATYAPTQVTSNQGHVTNDISLFDSMGNLVDPSLVEQQNAAGGAVSAADPNSNKTLEILMEQQKNQTQLVNTLLEQQRASQIALEQQRLRDLEATSAASTEQQRAEFLKQFQLTTEADAAQLNLTDAEREAFKDSMPTLEKLTKRAQQEAIASVAPKLEAMATQLFELQSKAAAQQGSAPVQAPVIDETLLVVKSQIPNADQLASMPQFTEFMNRPTETVGITVGDALRNAYRTKNPAAVVHYLKQFSQEVTAPAGLPHVQAAAAVGGQNNSSVQRNLKRADYDMAVSKFERGELTKQQFTAIENQFFAALQDGRVV